MGLMDILQQYAGAVEAAAQPTNADPHADYAAVAAQAPHETLVGGIAEALRSGQAGSFAESVEKLFANSNPDQKAGLLGHLVQAVEPAVLSSIAGGALARFGPAAGGTAATHVTPADAGAVTPAQAGQLAAAAQQRDAGIVERIGSFYARHPAVVKALGAAALAIAMNHMARHA